MIFVGLLGVFIKSGMNKVNLGGARMLIQPMVVSYCKNCYRNYVYYCSSWIDNN